MLKQTIIIHKNSETHKANKTEYLDVRHDDDAIKTIMSDHFLANPTLVMANLSPAPTSTAGEFARWPWRRASRSTRWTRCGACSSAAVRS